MPKEFKFNRIKTLREACQISQERLSYLTETSRSALSRHEREIPALDENNLRKIERFLIKRLKDRINYYLRIIEGD